MKGKNNQNSNAKSCTVWDKKREKLYWAAKKAKWAEEREAPLARITRAASKKKILWPIQKRKVGPIVRCRAGSWFRLLMRAHKLAGPAEFTTELKPLSILQCNRPHQHNKILSAHGFVYLNSAPSSSGQRNRQHDRNDRGSRVITLIRFSVAVVEGSGGGGEALPEADARWGIASWEFNVA